MSGLARTRVRRLPQRGVYERETVCRILDEAVVCHVGLIEEGGFPVVIPTLHARVGEDLYIHGSTASRMQRVLGAGAEVCVTVTLLDGLVLARSAFHHSVNYRSVVLFGRAEQIEDPVGKSDALEAFVEKLVPGRWPDIRHPSRQELRGTSVLRIALDEVTAKVRTGPAVDEEEDYELPIWAGVIPMQTRNAEPVADERLMAGVEMPRYVGDLVRVGTA